MLRPVVLVGALETLERKKKIEIVSRLRCNLKSLLDGGGDGLLVVKKSPKENKEVR